MSEEEIIKKCEKLLFDLKSRIVRMNGKNLINFLLVEEDIQALNGLYNLYNKEKEKNKALKEGLKYRVNYCKLLEKELYANGVNYEFEKTEIEKQFLEE